MELPISDDVLITHYGCSDFSSDTHNVFWIGAVYYKNSKKIYFFVSGNEEENIKEYYDFIKLNKDKKIIHWSMNSPKFGFIPIWERYKELTGIDLDFDFDNDIDLSEYFKEKYGTNYISRENGRLNNLAELNGFSGYLHKVEVSSKNDATNRLELLFSIYQAEQQGTLKIDNIAKQQIEKKTKIEKILKKLNEYQFHKLKPVTAVAYMPLTSHVFDNALPYQIAYLEYLGFVNHLYNNYCNSNKELHKLLADILCANERAVRGNINGIRNENSKDRERYTAHLHIENVEKHYLKLK